ncbi:MAG: hypothetical protein NZO16_05620, partial [Deltaproteobacteria bacterium]|nr:hypothetical protein [Deltaproteobacteria bacterium]
MGYTPEFGVQPYKTYYLSNPLLVDQDNTVTHGLSFSSVLTQGSSQQAVSTLKFYLDELNKLLGTVGAQESRLNSILNSLGVETQALEQALEKIKSSDV